jgi:lysophospholipase
MGMARAILAVLISMALCGCSREVATGPFAESRTPPELASRFFTPEGWAWGYLKVGAQPVRRYGVASTWRVPRATIVIVPGYGESAETWFETVGELNAEGFTVWVLDRAGQGGSARYTLPRDLGFTPSFDDDVAGLKALVKVVIRPPRDRPLILLGHADGAVAALRAAEAGLQVDGIVASSPKLAPRIVSADMAMDLAGRLPVLGRLPATDWRPWSRSTPDDRAAGQTHDPWRGAVTHAWQTANPDLRLSGPSLGWRRAFAAASAAVRAEAGRVRAPVLWLTGGPGSQEAEDLRHALPACRSLVIPGARPALHLEAATWRRPWFEAVAGFVAEKVDRSRAVKIVHQVAGDYPARIPGFPAAP